MQQQGMVLLVTVSMIVISMMLVLSLMQSVYLYLNVSNQFVVNHQMMYQLESIAKQIALSSCVVADRRPNQLLAMVKHHQGCSVRVGNHLYHYVVGDLGVYPCLLIASGNINYSSHHWLITISSDERPYHLLQIRKAKPAGESTCDSPLGHLIKAGTISWRSM